MGNFETPKTFEEAIQSENSMKWHKAMKDEISAQFNWWKMGLHCQKRFRW